MPQLEELKERQRKRRGKAGERVTEARASTTDPDARVMRMADGGYRPAYNAQFATDAASHAIVGVGVETNGADQGQALPMEAQAARRTAQHPKRYLMDGGYVDRDDITAMEKQGIVVYAPLPRSRTDPEGKPSSTPHRGDSPEVEGWRTRMTTEEAKTIYKHRGATAECANAHIRVRCGLQQFTVRGVGKVLSVLLLAAITHDLLRWIALAPSVATS